MVDLWSSFGRPLVNLWLSFGRPRVVLWLSFGRPRGAEGSSKRSRFDAVSGASGSSAALRIVCRSLRRAPAPQPPPARLRAPGHPGQAREGRPRRGHGQGATGVGLPGRPESRATGRATGREVSRQRGPRARRPRGSRVGSLPLQPLASLLSSFSSSHSSRRVSLTRHWLPSLTAGMSPALTIV